MVSRVISNSRIQVKTILRDLLGHIDIKTTSLYVNMANSDKVDALNALNKYLVTRKN